MNQRIAPPPLAFRQRTPARPRYVQPRADEAAAPHPRIDDDPAGHERPRLWRAIAIGAPLTAMLWAAIIVIWAMW